MSVALRVAGDATAVVSAARDRVRLELPGAALFRVGTVQQMYRDQLAPTLSVMRLLGAFAGFGLAMAAIGVSGVLSYSVTQRTRELGIRLALGAHAAEVRNMVVWQAMTTVVTGAAVGTVIAVLSGRLLATLLYDVKPADPTTLLGVAALLVLVGLTASYLPARRAASVAPVEALRTE